MIIGHSGTDKKIIRTIIEKKGSRIYFIGIGGVSMSALAEIAKERGLTVSGSDVRRSAATARLEKMGVRISYSESKANVMTARPDLVVYSLSISRENSEYAMAKRMAVTTVSRAELLGVFIEDFDVSVGVSGSHGKSTTTAMLGNILARAGLAPSVLCGAELSAGSGYLQGSGAALVYEACEYGDSFLHFVPSVEILLNLDLDHTDYFDSEERIRESFLAAAELAERLCVLNADSAGLRAILPRITVPVAAFSREKGYDYYYEIHGGNGGKYSFSLYYLGERIGNFSLGARGEFNVTNAVAAAIAAIELGCATEAISEALESFGGIPRRLEHIGRRGNTDVFYDYAHHPREIEAVRATLSEMGYERILAVFAPHTYTRTKAFFGEFALELSKFSCALITEIYGAREAPIAKISASSLAEQVKTLGGKARAIFDTGIGEYLKNEDYDCLLLMGAGDLDKIKKEIEDT